VTERNQALEVGEAAAGKRLDLFVGDALGLSRARVKKLFETAAIRLDGRVAKKGQSVSTGQQVSVLLDDEAPAAVPSSDMPLSVLSEDAALLFLDKPAGIPSHPLRPGETGTLANALLARFPECEQASLDPREAGLCHRLDIDTSGVLMAARTRDAWQRMRDAFGGRDVDKRYLALVTGPLADDGEIDLPLRHHPRHPDRVEPAADGVDARPALSGFQVLSRQGDYSLVEVRIHTGVLHQVRAHLAAIGAPLVGDALYGGRPEPGLSRFFLHARSLGVVHPLTQARHEVRSPLPSELRAVLDAHHLPAP